MTDTRLAAPGRSPEGAAPEQAGPVGDDGVSDLYRMMVGGVTIVTAHDGDGPVGCTASAVTSVSLEPPLLLVCLSRESRTLATIRRTGLFGVHLLGVGQQRWAVTFADRSAVSAGRFDDVPWRLHQGVPVLPDSLAWGACRLHGIEPAGDHDLVLGRVLATGTTGGLPLVWHDSAFRQLAHAAPA